MTINKPDATPDTIFNRVELLTGPEGLSRLASAHVFIAGIGGVGSWAAESLVRTCVGHITIADADTVAVSNINRQLMATYTSVGRPKTEVLAERLLDINPSLDLSIINDRITAENIASMELGSYGYVIDAIDSLADKAALILDATSHGPSTRLYSSMGAALRLDPTRISTAEFWNVKGDALAAALRHRFRRRGVFPARKFKCVYSEEPPRRNHPDARPLDGETAMSYSKVAVNGAVVHVTAIFGFTIAGLVTADILT